MKFPSFGFGRKKKKADDDEDEDFVPDDADDADELADAEAAREARGSGEGKGKASAGDADDDADAEDVAARILASLPQVHDDLDDEPVEPPAPAKGKATGGAMDASDDEAVPPDDDMPAPEGEGDEGPAPEGEAGEEPPDFGDDDEEGEDDSGGKKPKLKLIAIIAAAVLSVSAIGGGVWWWLAHDSGPATHKMASETPSGPRVELALPPPPGAPTPLSAPASANALSGAAGAISASGAAGAISASGAAGAATAMATGAPTGGAQSGAAMSGAAMSAAAPSGATSEKAAAADAATGGESKPAEGAKPEALPQSVVPGAAAGGAPSLNTLAATLQGPGAGMVVPPVNITLLQTLPAAPAADPLPPAPDATLVEPGPDGPLPRAAGNKMAWQVYARPAPAAGQGPKIAVVVGGLGLSSLVSRHAFDALPAEVSIAFDPYGRDVATLAQMARTKGHETLIAMPLEASDFPFSDPGPLGWLMAQGADENVKRLNTVLSRFPGYVGVVVDLTSRVAEQSGALRPLEQTLKARGLLTFHPGGAPGAGATVIRDVRIPSAAADVVIDETPTENAIMAKLADLEAKARAGGSAIGYARPYPATLQKLGPWLLALKAKGITLVPLTALAREG